MFEVSSYELKVSTTDSISFAELILDLIESEMDVLCALSTGWLLLGRFSLLCLERDDFRVFCFYFDFLRSLF